MGHKNPEEAKEYQREWYKKNREVIRQRHHEYYVENKNKITTRIYKYRKDLGDKYNEYQNHKNLTYRQKYPEKSMYILLKSRAKKNNIEFNLDLEDIKIPTHCPVLKTLLVKESIKGGKKGPKFNSPSIDRIDNTKGYIKGNIQIISHKANTMKGSASPQELLEFAFWVLLTYGYLIDKEIN